MVTERIVTAISSLSECDMLDNVRAQSALGDVYQIVHDDVLHVMRQTLPMPSSDAVHAFESALQTGSYTDPMSPVPVAHVSQSQDLDLTKALAMVDTTHCMQDSVIPEHMSLPSPHSLLAEGVRHLQSGMGDGLGTVSAVEVDRATASGCVESPPMEPSCKEPSCMEPSWMEAVPPLEKDAFQRGLDRVETLFTSNVTGALSQKDLLQLQFAIEEINVYKEIGLQISKKSASNVENVLKQQE